MCSGSSLLAADYYAGRRRRLPAARHPGSQQPKQQLSTCDVPDPWRRYVPGRATIITSIEMIAGYLQGNSQSSPGYMLVNQSNSGIIYVSIQYRLASFGFLGNAEVRDDGTANAGLLDQRAALQWVQRNIRAFGGDPSKVTIIGGSASNQRAGGRCVFSRHQ